MNQPREQKPAVLHVDDDSLTREMLAAFFSDQAEFDFQSTENPKEIPRLCADLNGRVRLVLVDGMIEPGGHGVDVVEALDQAGFLARRDEILREGRIERSKLATVLISGGVPSGDLKTRTEAALEDGRITALFKKPFDPDALTDFITKLLSDPVPPDFLDKMRLKAGQQWASRPRIY